MIEADAAKASAKVQGSMNAIDSATGKSTKSIGIWGAAFKGAFVGAVAGMTFSTIISGITSIGESIWEAGKNAVIAAAQFQDTTNAMKVFTGSTGAAKAELRDLQELARNTVGLRMADAEAGAIQLRGLGFAAKTAQDLLAGLAKQRTLNPAIDDAAVSKVIRNITQLSEGSPRAGQDIREMIAQMPTLNRIINDTFGSQQKFQQLLKTDSKDAIRQFTEALANTEGAAGGLNNAIGKLGDAWLTAGRLFGEPFLDPITAGVGSLTTYLYDNESTWRSWGNTTVDAINGVINAWKDFKNIDSYGPPSNTPIGATAQGLWDLAAIGNPVGAGASVLSGLAQKEKERRLAQQRNDIANESDRFASKNPAWSGYQSPTYVMGDSFVDVSKREADAVKKINQDKIESSTQATQRWMDREINIVKTGLSIELSLRDSHLRKTTADERKYQSEISKLKLSAISQQRAIAVKAFDAEIALNREDDKKIAEINARKNNFLLSSDEQFYTEKYAAMRRDRELEKQMAEERRRDLTEFNNLELRASKQRLDARLFDVERMVAHTGAGYDQMIAISREGMLETTRIISENLALQLDDESLTAQQRVNITKQANLEIQEASEAHRVKITEINDRMAQRSIERIRQNAQDAQSFMGVTLDLFQTVSNLFAASPFFGKGLPDIGLTPLLGSQGDTAVRDWISGVNDGSASIGGAQIAMQDKLHELQMEQLDRDIRSKKDERDQTPMSDTISSSRLSTEIRILQDRKALLGVTQAIEQNNLKEIVDLETINNTTKEITEGKKDHVLAQISELTLAKEYQQTVIDNRQQEVLLGDAKLLQMARETELLKGITELRGQELNAIFRIDRAQLAVNQKLVYSKNQADASVAEFLAGQKGITEIVSDVKINMLTTAYSGLDAVAGRLTKSFGMFRDVIKDLLANLLKLALNSLFQKMGFAGFGGNSSSSSGGFSIPGLGGRSGGGQTSGGVNFGGMFGGGGGQGGTPNWNPMAGSGQGSNAWGLGSLSSSGLNGSPMFGGAATGQQGQGLLGAGGQAASGGMLGGGGIGGMFKGLAAAAPFIGFGLGSNAFKDSKTGSILGGVGGALAGFGALGLLAPSLILGSGATMGAAVGLAALSIGAVALAPLLILGAFFLNRRARRKKEEKIRTAALNDAGAAIDKLISDVNGDRIDGAAALSQADGIRSNYLTEMNKLKDKKTRRIALAAVSNIDAKIAMLKTAVGNQVARKERLDLMVPTFASGGNVAPVGYQTGSNQMGYFPAAGTWASYNERGNEYIFDAETTRNIGVSTLDSVRASKGRSFGDMRRKMPANNYAVGGNVTAPIPSSVGSGSSAPSGPVKLEVTLNVGLATSEFAQVVNATISNNDGSKEQLDAIVTSLKNEGYTDLAAELARQMTGR